MLKIYPYESLGHADHGWLNARHHFSFAEYRNKERMNFGVLRVINDDIIDAQQGFAPHPHRDMEIITYVRQGAITHKDSMGNAGRTGAGDVQVMSAGTGVTHSEYNLENEATRLYQIWIIPNKNNVTPRWEAMAFPKDTVNGQLPVLVSGRSEHANGNALFIHQDAAIYGGCIGSNGVINQPVKYQAYVLVSRGEIVIDGKKLQQGDGAEITDTPTLQITSADGAEVLVIDVPNR